MRIVLVEIENFRGIKKLDWAPAGAINCLIGPGDSTKTTILDGIELALNPRSYSFADDSDFFDTDHTKSVKITVTLAGLPAGFKADDQYGLHLRSWNPQTSKVEDEPRDGLEEALSLRVVIDGSLEARWSIFNERIPGDESDPPALRYKHARQLATTRLGPYADHHLGWSRQSVLTRLGESVEGLSLQLAESKGGNVHEWPGDCSTEERIFLDVPWATVVLLVTFAAECVTADSVRYNINKACKAQGLAEIADLTLPVALDTPAFRSALGKAAKNESNSWFKDITRGERVGDLVGECLGKVATAPLAQGLTGLRQWIDG